MLYLQARIHLQEVELLCGGVIDELHRTRAVVADSVGQFHRRAQHGGAHDVRQVGGGRLLDDLLMVPLDRAVTLKQVHCVVTPVTKDLNLHMPGPGHIAF